MKAQSMRQINITLETCLSQQLLGAFSDVCCKKVVQFALKAACNLFGYPKYKLCFY